MYCFIIKITGEVPGIEIVPMSAEFSALVLAAGEGTRMKSAVPKVLHAVCEVPMILRVLKAVAQLHPRALGVVVGAGRAEVAGKVNSKEFRAELNSSIRGNLEFIRQKDPKGSGHAVQAAADWIQKSQRRAGKEGAANILILCGDTPLISSETLASLVRSHSEQKNALTLCSMDLANPFGYGRVVRNAHGKVLKIVEEKDASEQVREVTEVNTGIYCFDSSKLLEVLPELKNENAKKEFYLTDVVELFSRKGYTIDCFRRAGSGNGLKETLGINTRADLAGAEESMQKKILKIWMDNGVTILSPASTYIGEAVEIGADTVIFPGTILLGKTRIGNQCKIGPHATIEDSEVGNQVAIRASFVYGATIQDSVNIGPFSHLRPGTIVRTGARIGNFTEIKNSDIGAETKVSHLSYVGDATLGADINVGAGMITCNFDGKKKHKTVIGSKTFIGSNVNLIAPVKIGANSVVGAGSTITDDVPPGSLAIERSPQVIKRGWVKRKARKD